MEILSIQSYFASTRTKHSYMEYMSFSNWTRIPVEIGMGDATRGKMECQVGNKAPR